MFVSISVVIYVYYKNWIYLKVNSVSVHEREIT